MHLNTSQPASIILVDASTTLQLNAVAKLTNAMSSKKTTGKKLLKWLQQEPCFHKRTIKVAQSRQNSTPVAFLQLENRTDELVHVLKYYANTQISNNCPILYFPALLDDQKLHSSQRIWRNARGIEVQMHPQNQKGHQYLEGLGFQRACVPMDQWREYKDGQIADVYRYFF